MIGVTAGKVTATCSIGTMAACFGTTPSPTATEDAQTLARSCRFVSYALPYRCIKVKRSRKNRSIGTIL